MCAQAATHAAAPTSEQVAADAGAVEKVSRYAGLPLTEALAGLRASGLNIIFSSNVVLPEMTVETEPRSTDPRRLLEELLAPHGLEARDGPGGTVVVVPGAAPAREGESIRGFVGSRRNSAPVTAAAVRLMDSEAYAEARATTDADGRFRLSGIAPGTYSLEILKRGFVVRRVNDIAVIAGSPTELTILMDPAPFTEEELVVTPSRLSLLRREPAAPLALSRNDILALPHLGGDLFRALSLLPGVSANDVSAEFHVRGGRRDETQILLDGQELYATYHLQDFDNALSVVPQEIVDSVDLSTGGFSAEHGDRMSGVLNMTTVTPTRTRTRIGASVLNAHAGSVGTFHRRRGSWIAQARRGTTDFVGKLLGNDEPRFWDAFGKLDYQIDGRNSLRLNALHADDKLEIFEINEDGEKTVGTDYESSYFWLTHQKIAGSALFFETAASSSLIDRDRRGVELEEDVQFDVFDQRELEVLALRQDWNYQATPGHYLKWGAAHRDFDTRYDYRASRTFGDPLAEIRGDPAEEETLFQERFEEEHDSAYVADRMDLGDTMTLELGLRYDRHTQTDESRISPRLNVAWAAGESGVFRLAWGRFNQSQRPYELQVEDGETVFHRVERSEQRVLGYERLFAPGGNAPAERSDRWLALRAELYQREVFNPLPRYENLYEPINTFPEVEPDRVRVAPDRSVAEGLEIFLRGNAGKRINWWANYAYSTTEDEIGGARMPRRFDQTHSLNLDLDYRVSDNWTLNFAWRFHTGWPTTPLSIRRVEIPDEEGEAEVTYQPVLGERFSARLSDYHRLDLRASRHWRLTSGTLVFFVDIQNLYDRKNPAGFDYSIDEEEGILEVDVENWAGFLPSAGISFEF